MRKKTRYHRAKISLRPFGLLSLCVVAAAFTALLERGFLPRLALAAPQPEVCSTQSGITLPLTDSWERVQVQQGAVLCAFRSKNGGFPTLNIIEEPNEQPEIRPGVMAREASIRNAYHLVGLTDARFSESRIEPLGSHECFHTTVRYMNQGMPVEGLIMQVQLPDRVYTVTLIDREGHQNSSKEALLGLLRGIKVPGDGPFAPPTGRISRTTAFTLIILIAASMLFFGVRGSKARKRR